MPQADAATASEPANASASSTTPKKAASAPEKKYKCQYCNRAFSRSEHRSRHERSRKYQIFCCCNVGLQADPAITIHHCMILQSNMLLTSIPC